MITPRRITHLLMLLVITLAALIGRWLETPSTGNAAPAVAPTAPTALMPFGYGAAVAEHDWNTVRSLGFNWMQVYDVPAYRYPVNVLYRVEADANDLTNLWEWQQALQTEVEQYGYAIDAYQIGNEVNLAQWGWEAPPNVYEYVNLLCTAYYTIKAADPTTAAGAI